jgi:hypothetical protein
MYHVGAPPGLPDEPVAARPGRIDGRVRRKVASGLPSALVDGRAPERAEPAAPAAAPAAPPAHAAPGAIIFDAEYRAARIRAIMRRAAQEAPQAAVGRPSSSSSK